MNTQVKGFLDRYIDWLRSACSESDQGDGWFALSFPFLDRHNDYLEVYARESGDGFLITDDGRTIRDLKHSGIDLTTAGKRRAIAESILSGFGLDPGLIANGKIKAVAEEEEFPAKLQGVLAAMLGIDSLAHTSPPNVVALFKDHVADWFSAIGARAAKAPPLVGRSSVVHNFDFVVPRTKGGPPGIVQAIKSPDRIHLQSYTFSVIDTRESPSFQSGELRGAEFFAVLNDERLLKDKDYFALLDNGITTIEWSRREGHAGKFAA